MMKPQSRRRGFTLIELLVVVAVMTILFALIFPAIQMGRGTARETECTNNLRQIGVTIHDVLTRYPGRDYCSGAFLPQYDGDVGKKSWVVDMRNEKLPMQILTCPSNPATMSESLRIETLSKAFDKGLLPSFIANNQPETLKLYRDELLKREINTTYCQIWTTARTDMLDPMQRNGMDPDDTLDPANTYGLLGRRKHRYVASDALMLFSDAQYLIFDDEEGYAAAITKGPLDPSDPMSDHDFDAIGPVHGGGRRKSANVLFADGHVEGVADADADGKINLEELENRAFLQGIKAATPGRRTP